MSSFLEDVGFLEGYLANLKFEISLLYEMKELNNPNNPEAYNHYTELQNKQLKKYINLDDVNFLNEKIKYINSDYATFKSDGDIIVDKDDKLHEMYENVMSLQRMSNPCKNNCIGGCDGSCSIQCADYCGINCEYSCDGYCLGDCADMCATYCSGQCFGSCITTCRSTCHNYIAFENGEIEPWHWSQSGY